MTADPVPLRPGLTELSGYHSPQVDVEVRLNTNESPLPPPPEWLDELRAELGRIDFNRYPDRDATELRAALGALHGVDPAQVFCANGSNEVLQCLLLAYGGPGRTAAVFEPTYALHSHIAALTGTAVVRAWRDTDHRVALDVVDGVLDQSRPVITFLCSPNNPTGRAEPPEMVAHVLARAPGLVVVDEAYGQFAPWSALDLVDSGAAGVDRLVVTRTFSKTWSMAACRLGYLVADPAVVAACQAVALPYHLDAITQVAGRLALGHVGAMEARVALITEERGRVAGRAGRPGCRDMAVGRQLHLAAADGSRRHRRVAGPARRVGARARLLALARARQLPARHGGHARGERPVPGRSALEPRRHAGLRSGPCGLVRRGGAST